jgi:hypothetical protein
MAEKNNNVIGDNQTPVLDALMFDARSERDPSQ